VRGDLASASAWAHSVGDADVVFHAGGPRMAPPLRRRHVRRLEARARHGARAVAAAAAPDAAIVVASCGIGDARGPLVIAAPALAGEEEVPRDVARVVRLPWAYGPGGFIRDVARGLQMRRFRIVGPGTNRIALIGASDAAAAILAAAAAPPGVYGVEEASAPTQVELVHHLCAGRGAPRPDHLPPRFASLSMGGVVVEALLADQRVPGAPPPGFEPAQDWRRDLIESLIA